MLDPIYNELADKVAREYPVRTKVSSHCIEQWNISFSNLVSLSSEKLIVMQKVRKSLLSSSNENMTLNFYLQLNVGALAARYHVNKYPTLKLFRYGQLTKKEYRGARFFSSLLIDEFSR